MSKKTASASDDSFEDLGKKAFFGMLAGTLGTIALGPIGGLAAGLIAASVVEANEKGKRKPSE